MSEKTETSVARRQPFFSDFETWRRSDPLRGVMDQLFGDAALQDWPRTNGALVAPSVDVTESDDEYRIRAEIPGVAKNDVNVELEQGLLTIHGEKKSRRDEKSERGRRLECSYGAFSRSFSLPQDANPDRVSAEFKDGVLVVQIAKRPESKPKQIAVKG